jgi:hypothetical protein
LIIVVANGVLTAIPAHPLDVAALTAGADLIVVGEVTTVVEEGLTTLSLPGGSASATLFKCSLRVDRVLKGELAAESLSFEFAVPRDLVGLGTVRLGQYGMFFLKTTDRDWEFFDAKHPALPAIWNAARPTGIPLQDVTTALGKVLSSATSSDSDHAEALDALGRLNTDLAKAIMREVLKNTSGELRLNIARTLVAHDDITGLQPVETALSHADGLSQDMLANLAGSLSGLKDPRAIPVLAKLARSDSPNVRLNAASALRNTASSEALAPLSELLSDANPTIRYYAVAGLGEITRQNDWAPSFDEFSQHETRYLTYWRNWVQANLR